MNYKNRYGNAGDIYEVNSGDVWSIGSTYQFRCGDLMDSDTFDWIPFEDCDIVYTDPPWNQGNEKVWRGKAMVATEHTYTDFVERLVRGFCRMPEHAQIFLQTSVKFEDVFQQTLIENGFYLSRRWEILYYRKNPCRLSYYARMGTPAHFDDLEMTGLDDTETPLYVLGELRGTDFTILDPCFGRGLTPVAAATCGLVFVGTELHPRRMAVTLQKVGKHLAIEPRRIITS